MTPKALLFARQTAALLRPLLENEEQFILKEFVESDLEWGRLDDRFAVFEPEEIEMFDFDEVEVDLGVYSGRGKHVR